MQRKTVFISYAREDSAKAERLYMDLRKANVDAWLDSKCLLPGQVWMREIRLAIKNAAYFIALISARSITKRGTVQRELKQALDVLGEIPPGDIFVIPARLDATMPTHEQLNELNWVDLYPSYTKGLERILAVLESLPREALEMRESGHVGSRAPIHYTPYRSFSEFVSDFVAKLPNDAMFADPEYAIYITYDTAVGGVVMPHRVRQQYPEKITIVLQNQFRELRSGDDRLFVRLWFDGKGEDLEIPHSAIRDIAIPAIGVKLQNIG